MEPGTYSRESEAGLLTVPQTFDNNGRSGLTGFTGIGAPNIFVAVLLLMTLPYSSANNYPAVASAICGWPWLFYGGLRLFLDAAFPVLLFRLL